MNRNNDAGTLSKDQRLAEIARILAGALLRLRDRAARPSPQHCEAQISPDSSPNCLEVSGRPRLTVHGG